MIAKRPLSRTQDAHAQDLAALRRGLEDAAARFDGISRPGPREQALLYCCALGRAYDAAWRIYERCKQESPAAADPKPEPSTTKRGLLY